MSDILHNIMNFLKGFQYYDVVLVIVLGFLVWKYGKNHYKMILLRIVMEIDAYQESAPGQEKLKLARKVFISTIGKRFKVTGFLADKILTDEAFARMVDNSLEYMKLALDQTKRNSIERSRVITEAVTDELIKKVGPDLRTEDMIKLEVQKIGEQASDKAGYAKLYAKYNEREKTSVGAEVGFKF